MNLTIKKSVLLFSSFVLLASCTKSKTEETPVATDEDLAKSHFSRQAMLSHFADHLIAPALLAFHLRADSLYTATLAFTSNPSQETLDTLQVRLDSAALAWQYCGWFRYGSAKIQFGAVDGTKKMDEINLFPISTAKTENYISTGDYTLANTDYDTRGLGAIDYLINPLDGNDASILSNFNQSVNRKEYLKAIALAIKTRANAANSAWTSEKGEYVASAGTDAGSATSFTVLDLDVDFENIKNYKVGVPVGRVQAGQTLPAFAEKTESYYGGQSVQYIKANIKAIENVWRGRTLTGVDGLGFDDYLNAANAPSVTQSTIDQFNVIYSKLDALPAGRLSDIIKTNKQPVQDLYTELQKLTRFLKSDMISVLGLSITYASGDGD